MGYKIEKKVKLTNTHISTGKTRHYDANGEITNIAELKIVKYQAVDGYYLIYFDAEKNELTDTFHDTINAAMEQAEWEFKIKPSDWS